MLTRSCSRNRAKTKRSDDDDDDNDQMKSDQQHVCPKSSVKKTPLNKDENKVKKNKSKVLRKSSSDHVAEEASGEKNEKNSSKGNNDDVSSTRSCSRRLDFSASTVTKDQCKPQAEMFGYDDEISYMNTKIENLLEKSESEIVIVCGDAGIGKTKLIKTCMSPYPVLMGNGDDPKYGHLKVALIQLNGIFHGSNDIATIRLIDNRLNQTMNHESDDDGDDSRKPINDSIPRIISRFRSLMEESPNFRSIIVMENIEIFSQKQQTLLYNLFNLAQHGQSLLIIGTTRRVDFLELLEKRVRSRLTNRIIHLTSPFQDLEQYRNFCAATIQRFCQGRSDLEANFEANKESIEKDLIKSFKLNPNFSNIERIVIRYSYYSPSKMNASSITGDDPKISALSQLLKIDLILIILIVRNLKDKDVKTFNCNQLYLWGQRVPSLPKKRMDLIIKSIYNLIELDLVIFETDLIRKRSRIKKPNVGCVDKWTKLVPNVSDEHVEQAVKKFQDKIPESVKKLLL